MALIFKPKTERIAKLTKIYPGRIRELKQIFTDRSNIYIDYANVIHWASKLGWHVDIKRLYQLLTSFNTIGKIRLYNGTLIGNEVSEAFNRDAAKIGYEVKTKPVKIMKAFIDVSSIPLNSPDILKNFIKRPLLNKLTLETIEYLNTKLKELNSKGTKFLEIKKCNFDVEIGRDMLLDYEKNGVDTFALWSGDSDFADPVNQLLKDKKKVVIFATARRYSVELGETDSLKFDIQKIRNFVCRSREITPEILKKL